MLPPAQKSQCVGVAGAVCAGSTVGRGAEVVALSGIRDGRGVVCLGPGAGWFLGLRAVPEGEFRGLESRRGATDGRNAPAGFGRIPFNSG